MTHTTYATVANQAVLVMAEIKSATDAFDRGDTNVFDALDANRVAVGAYAKGESDWREAARLGDGPKCSQREKLDPVPHVIERDQRGDKSQIVDRTADGDPQLVTIDHSCEFTIQPLPVGSKHEEIPVLGEHDSAKF
jgi:hypothetical protein